MAMQVYGSANTEILQKIIAYNPEITDANQILVGTTIRFPDVSDLLTKTAAPTLRDQRLP
jgi:phage tail protein X